MIVDGLGVTRFHFLSSYKGKMHPNYNQAFPSTRWSLVVATGSEKSEKESRAALEDLCQAYWYPLYGYLRRQGHSPSDAEDLTQAFFAKLLSGDLFAKARPEQGKLRSFLLIALKRFAKNELEKAHALKRGGGQVVISIDGAFAEERFAMEPVDTTTPEDHYNKRWALTVLETAIGKLRSEYEPRQFVIFEPFLSAAPSRDGYRKAASALDMKEASIRVAIFRVRRRYGELLREQVADTVDSPREVAGELEYLIQALSR